MGKFIEVEKIIPNEEEKDRARQECIGLLNKLAPDLEIEDKKYGDMMQDLINQGKEWRFI